MNNVIVFLRSTAGKVILVLLLLIAAFYGGMEYKAYQIRSAMEDVFSGISDIFGGNTEAVKNAEKPKASNDLTKKVEFEITDKRFSSKNFQDQIIFNFLLTNNTSQNMDGVEGVIIFKDIFDNIIKEITLSYDNGLNAGETKLYLAGIDYNQFIDSDIKLKNTEFTKLKYEWQVSKIVYMDGSVESY